MREYNEQCPGDHPDMALATVIQHELIEQGEQPARTYILDPRSDSADPVTSSITFLLPASFGCGDVERAALAFLSTYLRSAHAAERELDLAGQHAIRTAEEFLQQAAGR